MGTRKLRYHSSFEYLDNVLRLSFLCCQSLSRTFVSSITTCGLPLLYNIGMYHGGRQGLKHVFPQVQLLKEPEVAKTVG